MLTVEQVVAAQKANLETLKDLTTKSVEKLVDLNTTASKAALAETEEHTKAILKAKDAQEFLALQTAAVQPLAEKTTAYSRHLYDIASSASAEFSSTLEALAADAQKKFKDMIEAASKNAPAGSESAVAFMNSAVSSANSALESVQKAVKQATALAESNFNAAAATATSAVSTAKTASKKR